VLNCKVDDIVEFIPDDQAKKVTPLVTQSHEPPALLVV
jgi:hypothetical protein